MTPRTLTAFCAVALLATACSGFGDLSPSGKVTDPSTLNAGKTLAGAESGTPAADWWKAFGDPQLNALIEEALKSNPGLKIAEARLAGARAIAGIAAANRMPQVTANFQADKERFPENYIYPPEFGGHYFTQGRLALDFSYELDFWGRNSALLDGAVSETRAAEVERDAARLMLAVAVARSYVDLDRLYVHRDLVEKLVAARRRASTLVIARSDAGLDEQAAVARFAAQVAIMEGEQLGVDQQLELVRHQLAALLGAGPDRGLEIRRPNLQDAGKLALPSVLPADLLGRRPDVVAQRLRVEAADKYGEAARAEFYPNVDLIGFFGGQTLGLGKLLDSGSRIVGLGAAVHLPVYGGGRLRAQLRQRYAEYDGLVAQYNNTLTDALKDIANAVTNWRGVAARAAAQRTATEQTGNARDNARRRYDAGLSNELMVIDRELDLLIEQRRSADVRAQGFAAAIDLNRALGGGFSTDTSTHAATPAQSNTQHAIADQIKQEQP